MSELTYSLMNRTRRKKNTLVVLFGGSFNPPTIAHKDIVLNTYQKLHNSFPTRDIQIVFMPTNRYYEKESVSNRCITEQQRLKMVGLLVNDLNSLMLPNVKFVCDDFEMKYGQKHKKQTPTFSSVRHLEKKYRTAPNNIFIILRQFSFESILNTKWMQSVALLERYNFIVLPTDISIIYQPGAEERLIAVFKQLAQRIDVNDSPDGRSLGSRIMFVDTESRRISGTSVRRSIFSGTQIMETITVPAIAEYIKKQKLYKSKSCFPAKTQRRIRNNNLSHTYNNNINNEEY